MPSRASRRRKNKKKNKKKDEEAKEDLDFNDGLPNKQKTVVDLPELQSQVIFERTDIVLNGDNLETNLCDHAYDGNLDAVKALLVAKADVNGRDPECPVGRNPLLNALYGGKVACCQIST